MLRTMLPHKGTGLQVETLWDWTQCWMTAVWVRKSLA